MTVRRVCGLIAMFWLACHGIPASAGGVAHGPIVTSGGRFTAPSAFSAINSRTIAGSGSVFTAPGDFSVIGSKSFFHRHVAFHRFPHFAGFGNFGFGPGFGNVVAGGPFFWGGDWSAWPVTYPTSSGASPMILMLAGDRGGPMAPPAPIDTRATVETTPQGVTIVRGPGSHLLARR